MAKLYCGFIIINVRLQELLVVHPYLPPRSHSVWVSTDLQTSAVGYNDESW